MIGEAPYQRMADYHAAADVCFSSPFSDASPRSIWEAMACGCACIVSDLPWVSELITPGTDALVVSTEVEAVERAMRRLVTDPALRDSFASRGRALAETHHDERREIELLEHVYREVAGPAPPAAPGGVFATRGEEPPAADQVDRDAAP